MDAAAVEALASADIVRAPVTLVPVLARGLAAARAARTAAAALSAPADARAEADFLLALKVAEFEDALVRASGIVVDALADREVASAGDTLRVNVNVFQPDGTPVTAGASTLVVPAGWTAAPAPPPAEAAGGSPFARFFREEPTRTEPWQVTVAADALPTQPYWLRTPRTGPVFTWTGVPTALQTRPFDPPARRRPRAADDRRRGRDRGAAGRLSLRRSGPRRDPPRRGDRAGGDRRLRRDAGDRADRRAAAQPRTVRVRVRSETLPSGPGVVRVLPPDGWQVTPAGAPITFTSRGEGASVPFTVTPPAGVAPGAYTLAAQVTIGGRTFDTSMQIIDYPHIQKHRLYAPARMTARVLDLAVAPVKVGYVMGGGDRVPEAIRRLGLDVTLLTDDDLASGDLARYGTIVVGVRASESRPAFVAANARLLQFVRDGGTLIVQYQQTDYTGRGLSPFPAGGNVRVSDERAPVTHPRSAAPGVHDAEPHHRRRLGRLGAGARPLRLGDVRSAIHAAARDRRSGRAAAARRPALRPDRQGPLRLHVVRVVPPAAGRRARRVSAVRQPAQPGPERSERQARRRRARSACRRSSSRRQAKRGSTPTASSQPSPAAQARSSWANAAS